MAANLIMKTRLEAKISLKEPDSGCFLGQRQDVVSGVECCDPSTIARAVRY